MNGSRIEKLEEFLRSNPENALLQYSLGLEYLRASLPQKALVPLKAAIAIQATYSAAYRELGKALNQSGQAAAAADTFRLGIQIAEANGDLQTAREMRVFLKRITGESLTAQKQNCCE
jgi:uncharacterized protein HemY